MAKLFFKAIVIIYILAFGSYSVHKYLIQRDSAIGAEIDYKSAILQMKIWELNCMYPTESAPSGSGT
jgi:hypothetical protein